jgi:hypothetical protein
MKRKDHRKVSQLASHAVNTDVVHEYIYSDEISGPIKIGARRKDAASKLNKQHNIDPVRRYNDFL